MLTAGHPTFLHPVVVDGEAWRGGLRRQGGWGRGRVPGAARRRPYGPARRSCAGDGPLPRAGAQFTVRVSTGGLPLLVLTYGCLRASPGGSPRTVAARRGRPPGDVRRRLCAGFRQCGSFVKVCAMDCVLLLGGGWCWCGTVAYSARSVAVCAWWSPSSTSASTSCLSRPILPRRLGGILLDAAGWVEKGVTPHQHWRRRVGRIEHHDRCLSTLVLVYFAHRMGSA